MRQIKYIFVHCTAGPQTQTVEQIQQYWKNVNHWKSPGYHYLIDPKGVVHNLLPEDKPSNGVQGYNSVSINVCYIGGVDKTGKPVDNRTDAQKEALIKTLTDLHNRYPNAKIMGHRDIWGSDPKNWKKQCPCFDVQSWWKAVQEPKIPEPQPLFEPVEEPKSLFQNLISVLKGLFKR